MDFQTLINQIKERNKASLSSTSSEDAINKVEKDSQELDLLKDEYDKLLAENGRLKDKIIDGLKYGGTSTPPAEDNPHPKTIEECVEEVLAKKS